MLAVSPIEHSCLSKQLIGLEALYQVHKLHLMSDNLFKLRLQNSAPACKKKFITSPLDIILLFTHDIMLLKAYLRWFLYNRGPEPDPQSNTGRHRVQAGFEKS